MDGEENKIYEKIENMAKEQYKNQIKKLKEELNSILLSLSDKLQCQNILKIISSTISLILSISSNQIEEIKKLYESFLQREEHKLRMLYKNLLTQKLIKESLDNKIRILLIKEKEYEIIKKKREHILKKGN